MSLSRFYPFAVLFTVFGLRAQTALLEDWESGIDESVWNTFGNPLSVTIPDEGVNGSRGFDCNGDQDYCSGVSLYWNYDLSSLPRFSFQARGHQSKYHWQYMAAGFGVCGYASYSGGFWDQPEYITGVSVEPKIYSSRIIYFAGSDTLSEDWIPELHDDVWMSYCSRINPDGTVSFFRNDTLRYVTEETLDLISLYEQAFALKGQSFGHVQVMDDVCVSPESYHEDWETGLNFVFWKPWGDPLPEIVPCAGWHGSAGLNCSGDGSWLSGVSSYQVFNLEMIPAVDFRVRTVSDSPGDILEIGWSSSNAAEYHGTGEQPDMLTSVSIDPSADEVTFMVQGEVHTAPWGFNENWVNCTIRINTGGSVSFFTADTLRWTSNASFSPGAYDSQSLTLQGTSFEGNQMVDEIIVYPSFYLPGGFLLPLNAIFFLDEYRGWAVGDNGAIVATDNGGASWEQQPTGLPNNLNDIHFENEDRGWICCDSGFVLSSFNGTDWIPSWSGFTEDLNGISLATISSGWTVGNGSLILRTENSGFNWYQQVCPFSGDLTGVEAVTPTLGYITGTGGHVIRTLNGTTWTETQTGVTVDLNGVSFVDALTGWAVGNEGTILKTINGGDSWILQESTVTGDLYGVSFYDEDHGWIVGEEGIILYSENSGETWVLQPGGRDVFSDVLAVQACLENSAWGVSSCGLLGLTGSTLGTGDGSPGETGDVFSLMRNPCIAGDNLCFRVNLALPGTGQLRIIDLAGRTVACHDLPDIPRGISAWNSPLSSGMAAGIYFCVFSTESINAVHSFAVLSPGDVQ